MVIFVEVMKERYEELLEAEMFLGALYQAGVDNWEGYKYAQETFRGMLDDQS